MSLPQIKVLWCQAAGGGRKGNQCHHVRLPPCRRQMPNSLLRCLHAVVHSANISQHPLSGRNGVVSRRAPWLVKRSHWVWSLLSHLLNPLLRATKARRGTSCPVPSRQPMAEPGSHQTPEPWATTWKPQTSGGHPWGSCAFSPQTSLQIWPRAPPWHHLAQRPTDILAIQGESWAETETEEGIPGSELGRRRACGLCGGRGGQSPTNP